MAITISPVMLGIVVEQQPIEILHQFLHPIVAYNWLLQVLILIISRSQESNWNVFYANFGKNSHSLQPGLVLPACHKTNPSINKDALPMLCCIKIRLYPKILHKMCMGHFSSNNVKACKDHTTLISRVRMVLIEYVGDHSLCSGVHHERVSEQR